MIDVRDLPELLRQVFVGVMALLAELVERLGLFERRQVLALQVLDERQLHDLDVVDVPHHDGHFAKPRLRRGVVPALAGDDLKTAAALTHDQRLDDPFLGHRGDELRQVAHRLPRLVRVGIQQFDRHDLPDRLAGRCRQRLDVMLVVPHP